jgi:hypothetical protein
VYGHVPEQMREAWGEQGEKAAEYVTGLLDRIYSAQEAADDFTAELERWDGTPPSELPANYQSPLRGLISGCFRRSESVRGGT